MLIKKVIAKAVRDSRGEKTIKVTVKTTRKFRTSAPCGKSTGEYEAKSYFKSLEGDINFINKLKIDILNKIINTRTGGKPDYPTVLVILSDVERILRNKIGANTLFSLEACLLKVFAYENKKELWEFLGGKKENLRKLRPVGNSVGGGLHGEGIRRREPDFQEFMFIADGKTFKEKVQTNELAYNLVGKLLKSWKRNDEGAWQTDKTNEEVLEALNIVSQAIKKYYKKKVDIGTDIASSSFYEVKDKNYRYKNPKVELDREHQVCYIADLIRKYELFYVEDPFEENDFSGFRELLGKAKKIKENCLIVGDDLTTTNPTRLKKAINLGSINAIIIKPNQIGSLLKVKEVIDIAKKNNIKTIISHRSGETKDNTIADLAVGWGCDFIKTGIFGKVRKAKLKRLMKIEKSKGG